MLAGFRFVLGAILAVTMLAVAGLGVVTSVALMRETHIAPGEDSRSLAYAGPATWHEFYDPDAVRRFEGGGRNSALEPPVPPARSLDTDPPTEIIEDKEHTTEAPVVPAAVAAAPAVDRPAVPPAERVASAPAAPVALSAPAPLAEELPPAVVPLTEAPPQPRPRPPFRKRVARTHIRRAFVARTQTPQYSPFGSPWPPFGSSFITHYNARYGTTTTWRRNAFGGPFANRRQ